MLLIVGPSGSGKSTLARGLAGLLPSQFPGEWQGSVRIDDREVAGEASEPGGVTAVGLGAGIVLQDPASQLVMDRVGDDVAFGLESLAWPLVAMRRRVPEALASVGLSGFEGRRSNRLSGGEQQRVALAGVLAPAPGLLVLDEPTSSLDPEGAAVVIGILAALRDRRAATIALVEHRAELAWPLADVVLALDADGRPIDSGPPERVLERSRAALDRAGIWLPDQGGAGKANGRRPAWAPGPGSDGGDAAAPAAGSADAASAIDPTAGKWLYREGSVGSLPVVDLRDVRFAFDGGEPVLREIDLSIGAGERVALTGPNGSGKTTLLRLTLGLLRPSSGEVHLGPSDPARLRARDLARLAGYVVQDPELGFLADTVREEIELGLAPEQLAYARELSERLSLPLEVFGDRSPYRLSGGEQRRLSLVTGLARRPLLLALDEPTFGQDRRGHEALVAALDELVGEGSVLLAATHDERFVHDATRRRVQLGGGWIVADEPVDAAAGAAAGAGT